MTTCEDCALAKAQRWWGGYRMGCAGCSARAIARSLAAFNVLHPQGTGDRGELRALLGRMLPELGPVHAKRAVLGWWRHDHEQSEGDE